MPPCGRKFFNVQSYIVRKVRRVIIMSSVFFILCITLSFMQGLANSECGKHQTYVYTYRCEPSCEHPKPFGFCTITPRYKFFNVQSYIVRKVRRVIIMSSVFFILCITLSFMQGLVNSECGKHQTYVYTIKCEPSCENPKPFEICTISPTYKCLCNPGFYRKNVHECVHLNECPVEHSHQ
ncbi:hypothetical protein RN001_007779 [Aquatica leii]|uniref:TIL domain-containing protein n=1 Tax=Aquatica leii TaxID=1421715 RepID=A0AAN7QIJ7_9COLE|nr:hypothetical protein RN001_007779 [Aquatica leii]